MKHGTITKQIDYDLRSTHVGAPEWKIETPEEYFKVTLMVLFITGRLLNQNLYLIYFMFIHIEINLKFYLCDVISLLSIFIPMYLSLHPGNVRKPLVFQRSYSYIQKCKIGWIALKSLSFRYNNVIQAYNCICFDFKNINVSERN